jgi:maleylacetoacetate isomerase
MLKLYTYFRSSAAYRVRIVLNLKGLAWEPVFVHLRRGGGEQLQPDYLALNPQGLVPTLVDDGVVLTQSLAIINYLEETRPEPRLVPADAAARARVRALALAVACDIHPLNNLRVLRYLAHELGQDEDARDRWYRHWVETGLGAMETMVAGHPDTGAFCHGDSPGIADACLVPQIANARRFGCDLGVCPTLVAIDERCLALEPFRAAAPEAQPDAED